MQIYVIFKNRPVYLCLVEVAVSAKKVLFKDAKICHCIEEIVTQVKENKYICSTTVSVTAVKGLTPANGVKECNG